MSPEFLNRLLKPHLSKIAGLSAAAILSDDEIGHVLSQSESLPQDLLEQIAVVEQLATSRNHDALLETAERQALAIDDEMTSGDLVVLLLLEAPDCIDRLLAERQRYASRRFDTHLVLCPMPPQIIGIDSHTANSLAKVISRELGPGRGGVGVRVYAFGESEGFRLMIRRGDAFACEATVDQETGETHRVSYRPERFDIAIYDVVRGALSVSVRRPKDVKIYLAAIGDVVFGDSTLFTGEGLPRVYDLNPLAREGKAALRVGDVPKLTSVMLTTLTWRRRPGSELTTVWRAKDVLAELRRSGTLIPPSAELVTASFRFTKRNDEKFTARLTPPNGVNVTQEHDRRLALQFFEARGMRLGKEAAISGLTHALLPTA